jgi:hypothetical protein
MFISLSLYLDYSCIGISMDEDEKPTSYTYTVSSLHVSKIKGAGAVFMS